MQGRLIQLTVILLVCGRCVVSTIAADSPKPRAPDQRGLAFTDEERAHWAYQPVRDSSPPAVKSHENIESPVDRFILAKLESRGLSLSPPADKRTLIRRVSFDLTGLPPAPEEVEAFLQDNLPDAYRKLVDRLLESPHYGERWGRHWMDVVRYADTNASDANAVMRYAWRYRDYIIEAFQRDLPYDQFIIEQLAGDLLPPEGDIDARIRRAVATGFLMVGPKAWQSYCQTLLCANEFIFVE